jgi:chromosome partitioning protein
VKSPRREIAHRVLLTRTSAAVTSRALKNVRDQLDRSGIPVLNAAIVERAAYRDVLDYGGLLSQLDPKQVSNLDKAIDNARAYVAEVLELLRATRNPVGKAA